MRVSVLYRYEIGDRIVERTVQVDVPDPDGIFYEIPESKRAAEVAKALFAECLCQKPDITQP